MRVLFYTPITSAICGISFLILSITTFTPAQIIGTIDTVGTTWRDVQHTGTCGRMISADSSNWAHVVWTKGLSAGNNQTHVYFNWYYYPYGWSNGNTGCAIDDFYYAGSCCLVSYYSIFFEFASSIVLFHGQQTEWDVLRSWVINPISMYPVFLPLPLVVGEGTHDPKGTIGRNDFSHFISYATCPTGEPFSTHGLYYCRREYDTTSHSWEFTPQQLIDCVTTLAAEISANRFSDRVAFVYTDIRDDSPDTTQYNNDIYLIVSEDGTNWDFENPINVTDFIPPDSLGFNGDTLRAYVDASIIFDSDDNIHIAFTTPGFYPSEGLISVSNSLIWHWSESTEYYSLIADGWVEPAPVCGAWQRYVQRPCLAREGTSGDLFIVYQQFDTSDIAANGYPQADAMISRSTDGGTRWSVGTNITNTHAPGANAGDCMYERDITCNETVENDTLHIFYILDKDAGSVVYDEGTWTLNQAICQRVPVDQIPATPLMPIRPMHIDSTGMPPASSIPHANGSNVPSTFTLYPNYPNPFNPTTTLQFDLNYTDHVTLKIVNTLGREITTLVDANLTPGTYRVLFTADNLSSGIYFYTLTSSDYKQTRKMVLLK